ncbi:MAG: sirohydrochlorin cobaltochelatase [Desulfobulbaceae bacterium]|jgi:sirohydrochlorin cobaltochelatase|nr:sirohydrochlorin cobaltochelatase [Desulfobulbaceae bacterium]
MKPKTAIVLAHFGTTALSGLKSIAAISAAVRRAYPDAALRLAFTSNIVRAIWHKRQAEAEKWLDQGVPPEILAVKNVIQTLGDLSEDGYRDIIVQPSHIFHMEECQYLENYVMAIGSIETTQARWRPFNRIVLGRPALGAPGDCHDYHTDVVRAAVALAPDVATAGAMGGALLYMGHGNKKWPSDIYAMTEKMMRERHPHAKIYIGVFEGRPGLNEVIAAMQADGVKKVYLKPYLVTAGGHANNDMAGDGENSWLSILRSQGFTVWPALEGLGENPEFARIFVEHIRDAAVSQGIVLAAAGKC